MSSSGHHEYDANLLASAPAPTKGMLQSGYATDLLEDKPKPSRRGDLESGRHKSVSRHTSSAPNGARASAAGVEPKDASTTSITTKPAAKIPFYRTRRGIIILVVAAAVILATIIGAVVGTQVPHNNSSSSVPVNPGTSGDTGPVSSSSEHGQGQSTGAGAPFASGSLASRSTTTATAIVTTFVPGATPSNPIINPTALTAFS